MHIDTCTTVSIKTFLQAQGKLRTEKTNSRPQQKQHFLEMHNRGRENKNRILKPKLLNSKYKDRVNSINTMHVINYEHVNKLNVVN